MMVSSALNRDSLSGAKGLYIISEILRSAQNDIA